MVKQTNVAQSFNKDLPYISVTDVISEVLVLIARLEKDRMTTNEALNVCSNSTWPMANA